MKVSLAMILWSFFLTFVRISHAFLTFLEYKILGLSLKNKIVRLTKGLPSCIIYKEALGIVGMNDTKFLCICASLLVMLQIFLLGCFAAAQVSLLLVLT